MSLILDALNRSQQERDNRDNTPGIQTQHPQVSLPPAATWRRLIPWAGLLAALCVIVWLLFIGEHKTATSVAEISTVEAPPTVQPETKKHIIAESAKPAQQVAAVEPPPREKVQPENSAVEDLYNSEVGEELAVVAEPVPQPAATPRPAIAQQPDTSTQKSSGAESEIDIEKMIAMARIEAENTELVQHSVPFLIDLSQQSKDRVPTIYYTQHDFSANSSQSSVTLNGETVRQGASLAGGLKLDEILRDSIIISHRGTQFRLKALNSWINL